MNSAKTVVAHPIDSRYRAVCLGRPAVYAFFPGRRIGLPP